MAAQADHQTTARIQDFMSALHEAKAEWGFAHMLIAQAALGRPIHLAQPLDDAPYWHVEPITEIVRQYVFEEDIEMPEAPRGEPLKLLPTRMTKVNVPLASISHWDPLLPVPDDQMKEDDHDYAVRQSAVALDKERSIAFWCKAVQADPSEYGSIEEKDIFLAMTEQQMRQRSEAWGQQAVTLRNSLGLQPARVDADGACGVSSLSVAAGGTASQAEKEALREVVRIAAPQILADVRFQKLLFFLEGEPAHVEAPGRQPALGQSLLGGSACEDDAPANPDGLALETSQAATPLSLEVAATATTRFAVAVANATSAEAETLDAAPPVTVATASMPESVGGFNLSQDIPDA